VDWTDDPARAALCRLAPDASISRHQPPHPDPRLLHHLRQPAQGALSLPLHPHTWEEERVLGTIREVAGDAARIRTPRRVFTRTATQGLRSDGLTASEGTDGLVAALEVVESCPEPSVFVFHDAHPYFGDDHRSSDPLVIRKLRDLVPVLKGSQPPRSVVFVSPTLHLPLELQKDVTVVEFVLPTAEEIRTVLDGIIQANRGSGRITIDLPPTDAERLVKAAVGLTLHEAENAFARSMVADGRLDASDVETVLDISPRWPACGSGVAFDRAAEGMGNVPLAAGYFSARIQSLSSFPADTG
jgi:hypothetical protein